jgi:cation diffusion facilitator family transporter
MQHEKEQVALSSIMASAGLTIAKAVVGLLTGSLGILSEAGHSLIDLGATVMTYAAVRVSGKPADEEHHYGHEKFEAVSALAETALLFLLSAIVVWEAITRLIEHGAHEVEATVWAFAVVLGSIVVDAARSRVLTRVAKATKSEALEADALHFTSDIASSAAVLIGLIGVRFFGAPWADSVAALVVAVLVCVAGWRLGRRTINTLTDVAPEGAAKTITTIAASVAGVVAVGQVRARKAGEKIFVEVTVAVSRLLPLDRVAAIKDMVAIEIRKQIEGAEPTVTTDPIALNNESVLDRVMAIARSRALAVHHVTVHDIEDRLAISLDLEVDGKLSLRAAHELADGLEKAIADELGASVEIDTHIEPLQPHRAAGREAPLERVKAIETALSELAADGRTIRDVHNVRVRDTDDGEIVNFHCRVDPSLTVQSVHEKVDMLERALRERSPSINRVIGHAEPVKG